MISHPPSSFSTASVAETERKDFAPSNSGGVDFLTAYLANANRRIQEYREKQRAMREADQGIHHEVSFSPSIALTVRPASGPSVQPRWDDGHEEIKEPAAKSSVSFFSSSISAAPDGRSVARNTSSTYFSPVSKPLYESSADSFPVSFSTAPSTRPTIRNTPKFEFPMAPRSPRRPTMIINGRYF